MSSIDVDKFESLIQKYLPTADTLITLLQDIQSEFRYLPQEVLISISERLGIPASQVYSVATFYNAFSLKPKGKHLIHVCLGTACHVKGGENILNKLERELDVQQGETTKDWLFTVETVRCIGCCSLAPVIRIDEDTYAHLTQEKIPTILNKYREEKKLENES